MTDDERAEWIVDELRGMPPARLFMSPVEAWTLLSLLQLALRHPRIGDGPRAIAQDLAQTIIDGLPPPLQTLAAAGFDPRHDVPWNATQGGSA